MRTVFSVIVSFVICAALMVSGCRGVPPVEQAPALPSGPIIQPEQGPETQPSPSERVPRITVEDLMLKIEQNEDVMIVDTRRDVETAFQEGHIKGAVPVPFERIVSGEWVLPDDKDREIVLYCS